MSLKVTLQGVAFPRRIAKSEDLGGMTIDRRTEPILIGSIGAGKTTVGALPAAFHG